MSEQKSNEQTPPSPSGADQVGEMKTGAQLIAEERKRQIEVEGWNDLHDEDHTAFQMSAAAACYIASAQDQYFKDHTHYDDMGPVTRFQVREYESRKWTDGWPWGKEFDKRKKHDTLRSLVIAGALIAAEIDRLQTQDTSSHPQ